MKYWLVAAFVAVLIGGYALFRPSSSVKTNSAAMMMTDTNQSEASGGEMLAYEPVGAYRNFNPEDLSNADGYNRRIIFFYAAWCPTCRVLDRNLTSQPIPKDMIIYKVDYDTSTELKQKYGVTYQHTLVQIDANGNLLKKWGLSNTIEEILEEVI